MDVTNVIYNIINFTLTVSNCVPFVSSLVPEAARAGKDREDRGQQYEEK